MAADYGGSSFQWATSAEERTKLWAARHTAYWAALQLRPGCQVRVLSSARLCCPLSPVPCNLVALLNYTQQAIL